MEEFFQALGVNGLIILLVVGVLAGMIASTGEAGAIAAGALATSGLLLIVSLALIGAVAVLLIARLMSR